MCCSMEGRWNGELTSIPMHEEGSQVCSSDVLFRDDEGISLIGDSLLEEKADSSISFQTRRLEPATVANDHQWSHIDAALLDPACLRRHLQSKFCF